ncbi:Glycosyl transferases group 1 [Thioclava dalianensis]|uniref:glycosyltransferase n=1 Tax=Thioclava dalianensis TaxID=1185766 RepID=UPI0008F68C22|nr:glycosyltransferase [Thioclava dalianensis]SFN59161.1 Glycosyl transferases group 1 [Thioclava dalianensis]
MARISRSIANPAGPPRVARLETIVLVSDSARLNGGTAQVVLSQARGLVALGYRVIVFTACGPVDPALASSGAEVICLDQPDLLEDPARGRAAWRGLWNGEAARRLSAVLANLDPARTALHAHSFSRALSPALGPVLSGAGIRALFTMHDYFLACPNGGFYDYPRAQICTRRPLGLGCLSTQCDARSRLHKGWRVARQAALWGPGGLPRRLRDIGYLSQTQLAAMRPYLPQGARLHHIHNPVEQPVDARRVRAEENDVLLFIGRLMPEKGALDFARAAEARGLRAVFVGAGPEEAAIRAACPRAELTGWLEPEGVAHWLERARALVFPSVWPEPFGLVAAQALARGAPVVAGRWTAAAEMIAHDRTGLIYAQRDDLGAALDQLDPARTQALSRAAFAARAGYGASPRAHCAQVAGILEEIVAR